MGGPETTSRSEYPPEFRPLAEAAVRQIRAMQDVNPFYQYAEPHPEQVAAMSPWQVATANTLPALLQMSEPTRELGQIAASMRAPTGMAMYAGGPTEGAQGALRSMSKYGGQDMRLPAGDTPLLQEAINYTLDKMPNGFENTAIFGNYDVKPAGQMSPSDPMNAWTPGYVPYSRPFTWGSPFPPDQTQQPPPSFYSDPPQQPPDGSGSF